MSSSSDNRTARPIDILLVDDDVDLITRSLTNDRVLNHMHRVADGVEAMAFLRRQDPYSDAVQPDLILLDLNMPRMDGREVLKAMKEDSTLSVIPVVVFTSSDDERDDLDSYKYKANSYVTKPLDLIKLRTILKELVRVMKRGWCWFGRPSSLAQRVKNLFYATRPRWKCSAGRLNTDFAPFSLSLRVS